MCEVSSYVQEASFAMSDSAMLKRSNSAMDIRKSQRWKRFSGQSVFEIFEEVKSMETVFDF